MTTDNKKSSDMSVEDILKSIKGIISGHNKNNNSEEEVLELTNIIKEGKKNDNSSKSENTAYKGEDLEDYLISEKSASETSNIFKDFANKAVTASYAGKKSRNLSMEELVIEMMKPQLSKWLNDNLPELVKQLVEKEIKRLVPDE